MLALACSGTLGGVFGGPFAVVPTAVGTTPLPLLTLACRGALGGVFGGPLAIVPAVGTSPLLLLAPGTTSPGVIGALPPLTIKTMAVGQHKR